MRAGNHHNFHEQREAPQCFMSISSLAFYCETPSWHQICSSSVHPGRAQVKLKMCMTRCLLADWLCFCCSLSCGLLALKQLAFLTKSADVLLPGNKGRLRDEARLRDEGRLRDAPMLWASGKCAAYRYVGQRLRLKRMSQCVASMHLHCEVS